MLTLALARGGRTAGRLDEGTAVTCSTEDREEARHGRRGAGHARAQGSQAPGNWADDDFDEGDSEDDFVDDESPEDHPWDDDSPEDGESPGDGDEDWDNFDEELDREFDEQPGDGGSRRGCSAEQLRRGTRVHSATIERTADGLELLAVELILC
ncbi:MAG: hypothetical protein ACR2LH_07845 [Thermoleophilaceae bacterium]